MHDMLVGPRFIFFVAYSTPIWHEKICMYAPENGQLLAKRLMIEVCLTYSRRCSVFMAQKEKQIVLIGLSLLTGQGEAVIREEARGQMERKVFYSLM